MVRALHDRLLLAGQRIERGEIQVPLDPERNLYLFPDTPEALAQLKKLKAGQIQRVRL